MRFGSLDRSIGTGAAFSKTRRVSDTPLRSFSAIGKEDVTTLDEQGRASNRDCTRRLWLAAAVGEGVRLPTPIERRCVSDEERQRPSYWMMDCLILALVNDCPSSRRSLAISASALCRCWGGRLTPPEVPGAPPHPPAASLTARRAIISPGKSRSRSSCGRASISTRAPPHDDVAAVRCLEKRLPALHSRSPDTDRC